MINLTSANGRATRRSSKLKYASKRFNKSWFKLTFTEILFSEKSFKIHRVSLVLLVWSKVGVHEQSHHTRLHTHNPDRWGVAPLILPPPCLSPPPRTIIFIKCCSSKRKWCFIKLTIVLTGQKGPSEHYSWICFNLISLSYFITGCRYYRWIRQNSFCSLCSFFQAYLLG